MSDDWNVYRTRFLVRAKQLTEFIEFSDSLGRQHSGKPGDYLVQSSEGLLRVAPREIFEDVYVVLSEHPQPGFSADTNSSLSSPESLPS
jgi:hypothetical protein